MSSIFEYQFIQHAILAGVFSSIVCGTIGVIIIEKKLVMMSGGVAHCSYGGIGMGYLMGFEPIWGAFLFSITAAMGIGFIKQKGISGADVMVGLLWSLGMAMGILFVGLMPGYPPDMTSYLFGDILAVSTSDLQVMVCLTLVVVFVVVGFFQHWKAFLFDEQFAALLKVKTVFLDYLLLILISLTIVVLIRVVGIVMAIALVTAPAATASLLVNSLKNRMMLAVLLGMVFCFGGLWMSYELGIASGASIVVLSVGVFLATSAARLLKTRINLSRNQNHAW